MSLIPAACRLTLVTLPVILAFVMRDERGGHAPPGKNYILSLKFSRSVPRGTGAINSYILRATDNPGCSSARQQPRTRREREGGLDRANRADHARIT